MPASTERFTFPGASGAELAARLDRPDGVPKAYALFAHCFTCSKDIFAASRIAAGLTEAGIAVLRFDFTGLGGSEGEFANTNFSSNVEDLVAAANHMRSHLQAPAILIGHSLGGAAVLAAAGQVPEARAIATIAAPADPAHVTRHFQSSRAEIEATGEAEVLLVGRPFRIKKQFLDDIEGHKLEQHIASLKKALLIFHSPVDASVGIENAGLIFKAAKHPKSFVSLDKADHLLSDRADAAYVATVIAAWAGRYLEGADGAVPALPEPIEGTVAVAETGTGRFSNAIITGSGHLLNADEPKSVGGDDTGPSPYDLLLAALGACKSMTMRMYAERKGYKLERAEVRLRHDKVHAEDCQKCETKTGKVDQIRAEITITGDLSDDERQKIFEIAERCPVHRSITGEIIIEAELKG
ncbi:MAG: OsmC family protein [Rhodospirillales bacterium]|nr:OsmC family protein [Rhodospirillales bacterium]